MNTCGGKTGEKMVDDTTETSSHSFSSVTHFGCPYHIYIVLLYQ